MEKAHNSKILFAAAGFLTGVLFIGVLFYFFLKAGPGPILNNLVGKETFKLSLTEAPADGASLSQAEVKISGKTGTEAIIVINGGSDDSVLQTAGGKFQTNYKLLEGENELTITAFDQNSGEILTTTRSLLYLSELESL